MGLWIIICVRYIIKFWFWSIIAVLAICGGLIGTVAALGIWSLFNAHVQDTWPMIFIFLGMGLLVWSLKFILLRHFAYNGKVLWFI